MKELTDKERIFVLEYLSDEKMNAERAALKGLLDPAARTKNPRSARGVRAGRGS